MPDNAPVSQISEMLLIKLNTDVPDWMEKANCLDAKNLNDPEEMGELCKFCPVRSECQDYADEKEVASLIWGGRDYQTGEQV